jgi:hypothetical protein
MILSAKTLSVCMYFLYLAVEGGCIVICDLCDASLFHNNNRELNGRRSDRFAN